MTKLTYALKRKLELTVYNFFKRKVLNLTGENIEFRPSGLENLTQESAIVVANHEIGPDSMLLGTQLGRPIHYLVDASLTNLSTANSSPTTLERFKKAATIAELKVLQWALGQIPLNVDKRSSNRHVVKRVSEYLATSRNYIGIFSEGPAKNLTREGKPILVDERIHNGGAAHFAISNNRSIIPVALVTTEEVVENLWEFPYSKKDEKIAFVKRYVARNGKIPYCVCIGAPIFNEDRKKLTEMVKTQICEMYHQAKKSLE